MKIITKNRNSITHNGKKAYFTYKYTAKGQVFKYKQAAENYNNKPINQKQ